MSVFVLQTTNCPLGVLQIAVFVAVLVYVIPLMFTPISYLFRSKPSSSSSNFRWPQLYHDVSLAKEVIPLRPKNASDWECIAVKLSFLFSSAEKAILIKGRARRERLDCYLRSTGEKMPGH